MSEFQAFDIKAAGILVSSSPLVKLLSYFFSFFLSLLFFPLIFPQNSPNHESLLDILVADGLTTKCVVNLDHLLSLRLMSFTKVHSRNDHSLSGVYQKPLLICQSSEQSVRPYRKASRRESRALARVQQLCSSTTLQTKSRKENSALSPVLN